MNLVLSPTAEERLLDIADFYVSEFGAAHALKILSELDQALIWIQKNPRTGAFEPGMEPERKYRRWIIAHIKVIYFINVDEIRVADIFDTRQDPIKMKV